MTIRKAQLKDIPDLIRLNEKFNGVVSTKEAMADSLKNNKNEIIIVAVCDDKAVGFVCGQIFQSICYPNCSIGEVTEMFVYKNYRRTGIATKLMQCLESEFAKNNATNITLKTGRDNKKARKFYKNCGYEKDDEIVYEKELPQ